MLDLITLQGVDIRPEISFFRQDDLKCPACDNLIDQEDMRMGSGRLDAGDLTPDLHRLFIPTEEYGQVYPLIYNIYTCNHCCFSALKQDFSKKYHKDTIQSITASTASEERSSILDNLFSDTPDFSQQKTLPATIAAYMLAMTTYNQFNSNDSGVIRMAICAIRIAWLFRHMQEFSDDTNLKYFETMFYRKAFFLYDRALELNDQNIEETTDVTFLGPDFDKDYGYDGVVYMHAWLYTNYGYNNSADEKGKILTRIRMNLSKVFGFGKSSREKPSALLEIARDTYEIVNKELQAIV